MPADKILLVQLQLVDRPDQMITDYDEETVYLGVPEGLPADPDKLLEPGSPLYLSLHAVLMGMERELTHMPVRMVWVRFEDGKTTIAG